VLGIAGEPQFLRAPDSGLAALDADARDQLVTALARRIRALRAQVIFAPWARDPHPDHVVTAAIVQAAMSASGRKPVVYSYGVWLAVRGTGADQPDHHEVRICEVRLGAAEIARKRAAIMEHRSQTGALIDDDPEGFRIDAEMLATWLRPVERFFVARTRKRVQTIP
jgi:LmbE family N-acetylglucosaminyl deacetylase